jgi:hypothetical protein
MEEKLLKIEGGWIGRPIGMEGGWIGRELSGIKKNQG